MRLDKLTVKAQEALQAAQSLASERGHQAIEPEHLLQALMAQKDGTVPPILGKLGVRSETLTSQLEAAIEKLPQVRGGSGQYMGERLRATLERAERQATQMRDEYTSTEHVLMAMADERQGEVGRLLAANGVTVDAIRRALVEIRGNQRVTDQNPEDKYQALQRYSRDLTDAARRGKLDPVIGRDEEIRRVIQVLSRRTKNNPVLIGEPGVGKTAIVEGLAQRIVDGDVPDSLRDRRILALEIEQAAVGKDETAAERREEIERDLADLREQEAGMRAQWQREKEQAEGHGKLRERLDQARVEFERATREGDLERAGELRYGEIPELERKLAEAEARGDDPEAAPAVYLSEKVDAD